MIPIIPIFLLKVEYIHLGHSAREQEIIFHTLYSTTGAWQLEPMTEEQVKLQKDNLSSVFV